MRRRGESPRSVITISDVAKAAGVATSTVSRALTQPGRVSEDMRRRVESVARELGYSPNPQARSLTSGRTHSMALLIPGATNPYFFDLIRGTQIEAKVRGYRHVLVDTEASAKNEAAVLAELPRVVDGVVLAGSRLSDSQLREVSQRIPLVVVNREVEGVQSVVVDTSAAVTQALNYLASLGHTRTVFLSSRADSWSSRQRWEALERAAAQLKIDCVKIGPFTDMRSGAAAADAALHYGATACLFFNDMLAIGALKRFSERGIVVPRDISVVGCDDIFGADFCNPPLTTLTAPIDQVARIATDMLLTRLLGLPLARQHEKVLAHLTVRQSTGTVPIKGRRRQEVVRRAS
jgi:DNA-binding LacI/PurR family transcriptional regulator